MTNSTPQHLLNGDVMITYKFQVKIANKEPCIFKFTDWNIATETISKLCLRDDVQEISFTDECLESMRLDKDLDDVESLLND